MPTIEELQKKQELLIPHFYSEDGPDPDAVEAYDSLTKQIQDLHPKGKDCPCQVCDVDLWEFYSDIYKYDCGFRPFADLSVEEVKGWLDARHQVDE